MKWNPDKDGIIRLRTREEISQALRDDSLVMVGGNDTRVEGDFKLKSPQPLPKKVEVKPEVKPQVKKTPEKSEVRMPRKKGGKR